MATPVSTQQHIEIAGIKDGIIILRNGGYRMIMSVSTVNFALKSEEEQNSLIFQYQSFLNSLHFPIEIVMQSRRLDLTPYLNKVTKIKDGLNNELLQLQTEDYIEFVKQLISVANIMKKNFYVAVSHQPMTVNSGSILDKLFKKEPTVTELKIPEQEFLRHKNSLIEKANIVASGLGGMGLHCVQLTTEEIIELFYKIYNPDIANKEQISDVSELTSPIVEHLNNPDQIETPVSHSVKNEAVLDNSVILEERQKIEQQEKFISNQKADLNQSAASSVSNQSAPAHQNVSTVPQTQTVANQTSNPAGTNQPQAPNTPPPTNRNL